MDAAGKRAIHGRKGSKMSVLGVTLLPASATDRGRAAAADRPELATQGWLGKTSSTFSQFFPGKLVKTGING